MSHLEDRLAEFVFDELTESELETARLHVAQCLDCQGRVAGFRKVQQSLEQLPDVDVPRRMVFVPSENDSKRGWAFLRWGIPSAAAAALLLGIYVFGPLQFRFHDSGGLSIALGSVPENYETIQIIQASPPDYGNILARLEQRQQQWLASEIDQRLDEVGLAYAEDLQRLHAELSYLKSLQRVHWKNALENSQSIQLLGRLAAPLE